MKSSRQIIYPLNYLKIFFDFIFLKNKKFVKKKLIKKLNLSKNTLFLGRARSGIYLAIKIFINKKKPYVIMSPYTIPDVVNMVICAGGIPKFIDFSKKTTFLDLKSLNKKNLFKTSVLLLTHYNINEKNYKIIKKICNQNKITLIEDCAISNAGYSSNIPIGTLSSASIYSFSTFKYLNFFYGGLISLSSKKHFKQILEYSSSWNELKFFDYLPQIIRTIKYNFLTSKFIFNFFTFYFLKFYQKNKSKNNLLKRYSNFTIGKMDKTYFSKPHNAFFREIDRKISKLDLYQSIRRRNSLIYLKYLKSITVPKSLTENQIKNSSCYNYTIYVKDKIKLQSYLVSKGYDTGNAMYENCGNIIEFKKFNINSKNVDDLIRYSITLPTNHTVSKKYAENLSKTILNYYK